MASGSWRDAKMICTQKKSIRAHRHPHVKIGYLVPGLRRPAAEESWLRTLKNHDCGVLCTVTSIHDQIPKHSRTCIAVDQHPCSGKMQPR